MTDPKALERLAELADVFEGFGNRVVQVHGAADRAADLRFALALIERLEAKLSRIASDEAVEAACRAFADVEDNPGDGSVDMDFMWQHHEPAMRSAIAALTEENDRDSR